MGGYQGWRAWELGGAAASGWRNKAAGELVQEVEPQQDGKLRGEGTGRGELLLLSSAKASFTLVFE